MEVRLSNMVAAKGMRIYDRLRAMLFIFGLIAIGDAVRTSLGPRGMDKMVRTQSDLLAVSRSSRCRSKHPRER